MENEFRDGESVSVSHLWTHSSIQWFKYRGKAANPTHSAIIECNVPIFDGYTCGIVHETNIKKFNRVTKSDFD